MNREQKRKLIDRLANQAIKKGSVDAPFGLGIEVAQAIAKKQGATAKRPIEGTIEITQEDDIKTIEQNFTSK